MSEQIRRSGADVRAYADRLRALWHQLEIDPLDEAKSAAFVAHILNNRAAAARSMQALQDRRVGLPC
ncbi:hypothetical protein [Mycobacterium servetii]|uniref:Uncharacterized protein n=1 Tax=Mycobacterium servetii TaxID=3237418 RepID=A0ABV4CAB9_9MYCO